MKFNTNIGAVLLAFLFGLMVITGMGGALASAQTTMIQTQTAVCFTPANNLRYGSVDYTSSGGVTELQSFLSAQGYFNSAYLGSGRFGSITMRAVAQFQAAHNLPSTGYFGPLTRALVQQISCGTSTVPPSTTPVTIWSVNPASGPIGSTISVTGFGLTSNNTVLVDGLVAARGVPITSSIAIACTTNPSCHGGINQTLTFTMPSSLSPNCPTGSMCQMYMKLITPGVHTVSIQNDNGTSNTINFTVTGTTNDATLSVTGLDAPASLALGQSGTWSVHALSNGSGTLHYSVVWGDEGTITGGIMAPQNTSIQSSATFTHAYSRSGNYTPVFTVTDDFGHTVSTGNTVVVTPLY